MLVQPYAWCLRPPLVLTKHSNCGNDVHGNSEKVEALVCGSQLALCAWQDMAVYESFVLGMLTNFDAGLPLERIHNMLRMFVQQPPYDKSAEQLGALLSRMVAQDKLTLQGGTYCKR